VRAVCQALGVSRSHVLAKKDRALDWADHRRSPPKSDDAQVKQAIADVVQKRATYGYRRVWARLRLDGHIGINHKRVYRVMRDAGWLLFRQGQKPLDTRKHEGKVAPSRKVTRVGVQMVWSCHVTTVSESGWRLRWTVAIEM
jgi:putative transposase